MIYKIKDEYFNQIRQRDKKFEFRHKLPPTKNEMLIFENIDKLNQSNRFIFVKEYNWKTVGVIENGKITIDLKYVKKFGENYDKLCDSFVENYIKEKTYIIYIDDVEWDRCLKYFFRTEIMKKYNKIIDKKVDKEIEKLGYDSKKE